MVVALYPMVRQCRCPLSIAKDVIHPSSPAIMLFKSKTLETYKLTSLDGEIGHVSEFYFDDQHWTIRYLVAATGGWLTGRQVLISPRSLVAAIPTDHHIVVNLTKQQIEDSPSLDTDKPVSRQFESEYHGYYGWPSYWGGPSTWGMYSSPTQDPELWGGEARDVDHGGDHHLRSTLEVAGYEIHATDGDLGSVEDFIIDDVTWSIRYLIVNTGGWWPGKKVLVSPEWIEGVSWGESKVFVKLTREEIKAAPAYLAETFISRDYENGLFDHYRRAGYWSHEPGQMQAA